MGVGSWTLDLARGPSTWRGAGRRPGDSRRRPVLRNVTLLEAGDVDRPPAEGRQTLDVVLGECPALAQRPPPRGVIDVVAEDLTRGLLQGQPFEDHAGRPPANIPGR